MANPQLTISQKNQSKSFLINLGLLVIVTLLFYNHRYGLEMLLPTKDAWLMRHDWATHHLGWFFYRNEPWTFPLGDIHNYFYPVGTNVVFTDSIPLVAIPLKIFSPILPEHFQYLGLWLFLSHLLLGYFSMKVLDRFGIYGIPQLLATLIIVFNPVLFHRSIHPALCSHWLIVASIWIYFIDTDKSGVRKVILYQFIILILSGLINPYLCAMISVFSFALSIRLFLDKRLSIVAFTGYLVGPFVVLMVVWFIIGAFVFNSSDDLGISGAYGLYSMNLNSLVNSNGFSVFPFLRFPTVSWHQYESFLYLGAGIIALSIFTIISWIISLARRKSSLKAYRILETNIFPLAVLSLACTAFAITNTISINDVIILKFKVPGIIEKTGDVFRASARFFWVVYYMINLSVLIIIITKINSLLTRNLFLCFIFAIQIFDYWSLLGNQNLAPGDYHPPLTESSWDKLFSASNEITFYPPLGTTYKDDQDYRYFGYLAANQKKPINIGYVARQDNRAINTYTEKLNTDLDNERIGEKTMYVTNAASYNRFKILYLMDSLECADLDGYLVFYPKRLVSPELARNLDKTNSEIPIGLKRRISFGLIDKKIQPSDNIQFGIDGMRGTEKYISLSGWAFVNGKKEKLYDSISIILKGKDNLYYAKTDRTLRPDVSGHFNNPNLDSVGFSITAFTDSLRKGKYELGILIHGTVDKKDYTKLIKTVNIGLPSVFSFSKLDKQYDLVDINLGIDRYDDQPEYLSIAGWAARKEKNLDADGEIYILLKDEHGKVYYTPTISTQRPDVTSYFKNKYKLDNSGYDVIVSKQNLAKGKYNIGLLIHEGNSYSAYFTDRYINH
jgi:hypothetical protein